MAKQDKQIFEKLRDFRRARGISVDDLAKELGENSQKVGRIERGQRSLTVDYLLKISKALSTPIEAILEEQPQPVKENSFDSNILNDVVVLVEEIAPKISLDSRQKANLISKLYELALKLPSGNQRPSLDFLRDTLKIIIQDKSPCN